MQFVSPMKVEVENLLNLLDVTCHDYECQNNEHECCMLDNLRIDDLDNAAICVNFRKRN